MANPILRAAPGARGTPPKSDPISLCFCTPTGDPKHTPKKSKGNPRHVTMDSRTLPFIKTPQLSINHPFSCNPGHPRRALRAARPPNSTTFGSAGRRATFAEIAAPGSPAPSKRTSCARIFQAGGVRPRRHARKIRDGGVLTPLLQRHDQTSGGSGLLQAHGLSRIGGTGRKAFK